MTERNLHDEQAEPYRGWGRADNHFWSWVEAGYPQRWAFWRLRDELDGLRFGFALGVGIVLAVLGIWGVFA